MTHKSSLSSSSSRVSPGVSISRQEISSHSIRMCFGRFVGETLAAGVFPLEGRLTGLAWRSDRPRRAVRPALCSGQTGLSEFFILAKCSGLSQIVSGLRDRVSGFWARLSGPSRKVSGQGPDTLGSWFLVLDLNQVLRVSGRSLWGCFLHPESPGFMAGVS